MPRSGQDGPTLAQNRGSATRASIVGSAGRDLAWLLSGRYRRGRCRGGRRARSRCTPASSWWSSDSAATSVTDGAFEERGGEVRFMPASTPTPERLTAVLAQVHKAIAAVTGDDDLDMDPAVAACVQLGLGPARPSPDPRGPVGRVSRAPAHDSGQPNASFTSARCSRSSAAAQDRPPCVDSGRTGTRACREIPR